MPSLSSSTSTGIVNKRKGKGCVVAAEVNAIISIIIVTLINPILILYITIIPILTKKVTAASLACDGSNYWNKCWRHAAGFVCNPPLR